MMSAGAVQHGRIAVADTSPFLGSLNQAPPHRTARGPLQRIQACTTCMLRHRAQTTRLLASTHRYISVNPWKTCPLCTRCMAPTRVGLTQGPPRACAIACLSYVDSCASRSGCPLTGSCCLSIGTLYVQAKVATSESKCESQASPGNGYTTIWYKSGNRGTGWASASLSSELSGTSYNCITFYYSGGNSYTGDTAIDEVVISTSGPTPLPTIAPTGSGTLSIIPESPTGPSNWYVRVAAGSRLPF